MPAIILGIASLVKIEKSAGRLRGKGLAIAGIAVAVAFLLPSLARTRQIAFRMDCGYNMSRLATAMLIYTNDNDDKFPTPSKWCDLLIECSDYAKPSRFRCKGATKGPCNYAMNKNIEKYSFNSLRDSNMVLLFETHPGWNQSGGPEILTTDNHQGNGCNIMFTNFHVYFVKAKDLDSLRWEP
jgi:hypothetical protein